ncbi:hypothetical protein N7466_003848 [Penicillium verhagenii]|uniref:uncharacterized protein n=1 Tax=Penicillium verhagenii TaxID=1562060 RepID=UPI002545338C|nr:uncharacterized protein N7466_003848 [Penicillium verhagenii]KAJ5934301.1 hypothetical protein N7466_003848 [Penicillium verhagenii]
MFHRRGHVKSRHGCTICKTRRVKCDEKRPICSNCSQRDERCVYPGLGPHFFAEDTRRSQMKDNLPSQDQSQLSSNVGIIKLACWMKTSLDRPSESSGNLSSLDMTQLELVLQWINYTHKLLSRSEQTRQVWEKPVLEEALKAPFLMHGILALSALHLSHLRQDEAQTRVKWLDVAISHKSVALAMFSDQLRDIHQSNAKAMMVFAGLAFTFSLASAVNMGTKDDGPGLNALTEVFVLARGVRALLEVQGEFLHQTDFAPLFDITAPDVQIPEHVLDALDRLEQLQVKCKQKDADMDSAAYTETISHLRSLAAFTFAEPTSMTLAGGWAIRAAQKYLDDLTAQKPIALVVLAHYCVFIHMARDNWAIGYWGYKVFKDITQVLKPNWYPHIEWAARNILPLDEEKLHHDQET